MSSTDSYFVSKSPFTIPKLDGYLFAERFRKSSSYLQSWQHPWKLLWMRPSIRHPLDLDKLANKKFGSCSSLLCTSCSNGNKKDDSVLISTESEWNPGPGLANNSVGDFLHHVKLLEMECHVKAPPTLTGSLESLNVIMNAVLDKKLEPISANISLSEPENVLWESWDNPLRLFEASGSESSLSSQKLEVNSTGMISGFQTGPHNLPVINISHTGCTVWIIIHPSSVQLLLKKIGGCICPGRVPASASYCFFRNGNYSVTPEQLVKWGIKFTLIYQEEGDVLILYPGALFAKCGIGVCMNSSMNFLTLDENDSEIVCKYKMCNCTKARGRRTCKIGKLNIQHGISIPGLPSKIPQLISKWACNSVIGNPDSLLNLTELYPCNRISLNFASNYFGFPSTNLQLHDLLISNGFSVIEPVNGPFLQPIQGNSNGHNNPLFQNDLALQFQQICDHLSVSSDISSTTPSITGSVVSSRSWENSPTQAIQTEEFTSFVSSLIETPYKNDDLEDNSTNKPSEEQFKCQKCGKEYHYKSHLNRHTYIQHSERDISVKCPICGRKLAHKYTLASHRKPVSKTLTSRRRNWCRGLMNTNNLVTDGRKSCQICGERFVQTSGYNRHMKIKHPTK